jgi:hypothetical protein
VLEEVIYFDLQSPHRRILPQRCIAACTLFTNAAVALQSSAEKVRSHRRLDHSTTPRFCAARTPERWRFSF